MCTACSPTYLHNIIHVYCCVCISSLGRPVGPAQSILFNAHGIIYAIVTHTGGFVCHTKTRILIFRIGSGLVANPKLIAGSQPPRWAPSSTFHRTVLAGRVRAPRAAKRRVIFPSTATRVAARAAAAPCHSDQHGLLRACAILFSALCCQAGFKPCRVRCKIIYIIIWPGKAKEKGTICAA